MNDRKIEGYYCCEEHNNELIEARERSRVADTFMTPEVIECMNRITDHAAELRGGFINIVDAN